MSNQSPLDLFSSNVKKPKGGTDRERSTEQARPKKPIAIRNFAVEAMMERMNQMREEIDNKIDEVSRKHGLTREQITKYLSDPKNFTSEQWKFICGKNIAFTNKLYASLGITSKDASSPAVASAPATAGNRKGKLLGARRKWIPTR